MAVGGSGSGGGDSTYTAAYASRPAAGNDGDLFFPSDGFSIQRDTGAAWVPWGPLFPFTAPVLTDFAWINQETATATQTKSGIYLLAPVQSGDDMRILKKAAPSTPYTITVWFLMHLHNVDYNLAGLCFRKSSDGKLATFDFSNSGTSNSSRLETVKFNSPTSINAVYASVNVRPGSLVCLQISDNGTNRIARWSTDGQNFHTLHTVERTDFLTADEVGFYANSVNATYPAAMTLLSWKES